VASDNNILYTRYDRDAYLEKRFGVEHTISEDDINNSKTYPTTKQDIIKLLNTPPLSPSVDDDPEQKCTTYLAPSSIPNSGLGMYTTIPYASGESFPFPEVGIMLQEMKRHSHPTSDTKKKKTKLLAQYPWSAKVLTFGAIEVGYGESIVPSLGMLANSHLGLVNMRHSELWNTQPALDGTSSISTQYTNSLTLDDVGRGAISHHSNVKFESSKKIEAGEELFVSYGDEWFVKRENIIGIVPGSSHFIEADQILHEFVNQNPNVGDAGDVGTKNYELLLQEALQKDKRLHAAFPKSVHDVHKAVEMGTARFSAKESVRSMEWLEENGACIDNIISGITTIPQAGKGSFATTTRQINDGGVITTTSLITLERDQLYLWEDVKQSDDGSVMKELVGHQLLLNYCYGHKDSSLLFFPYSPSINFINHGMNKEDVNAKIRWSTYPYHKKEWLDLSLQDMKDQLHTGLMFDIVATRDIQRGEEILLDYGSDWVESWKEHANEWRIQMDNNEDEESIHQFNMTDRLNRPTTIDLNIIDKHTIVRTEAEQEDNPYPSYIMTRCRFEPPPKEKPKYTIGTKMSREFRDELLGITRAYSGKVIKYNSQNKMYSILYDEDGDEEEVSEEVLDSLVIDTTTSQEDSEEEGDCSADDCKPIRWTLKYDDMHIFPCTIQTRTSINNMDWYTALVEVATTLETTTEDDNKKKKTTTTMTRYHHVEYMPRYAILFVDRPYTKDQYAKNTFRHEIGLPDGILPEHWLDLKDEGREND